MIDDVSVQRLASVHADLRLVVNSAIAEFARRWPAARLRVSEGLRTRERQAELFAAGASKTTDSRHLTGHAADLAVLVGAEARWEMALFYRSALAVREAALIHGVPVVWGGCWQLLNGMGDTEDTMADVVTAYARRARQLGARPLIDGPHFELARSSYP
jgi:peptidoglycan L-alanyl-D-glutamate endopeptidase CwlK